jgi:hypothetical protein
MTLTLPLSSELQRRLAEEAQRMGVNPAECALRLLDQHLPSADRRAALVKTLQVWIQDEDAEEQKETGDYLTRVLDEDRLSERKLFPPELEGKSW